MYEVWYTDEGISQAVLLGTFDKAVDVAVEMMLAEKVVFEYIVGPQGEIRNDFVVEMASKEKKRRKNKKNRDSGKGWVVEIKAAHLIDSWAIVDSVPNAQSGQSIGDKLVEKGFPAERIRVRELPPEE